MGMKPERWQQIERLYYAALERNPAERQAFLDSVCADDESLRRELTSLIAAGNRVGSFLEPPAEDIAAPTLASGTQFDAYRTKGLLGKGGMGEVHLALDTRLNRNVAIKLLPPEFATDTERL